MKRYIPVAQTRPKPPRVWLLFLKGVGPKRSVLGTTLLPNGKGHFGQRATFKAGPEYSGRTKAKHLPYQPKFPEFWVEWKAPRSLFTEIQVYCERQFVPRD